MNHTVYLGLGSNLGDRMSYLQEAEKQLEAHLEIHILKKSRVYETEHWPKSDPQNLPSHLNQVIVIETALNPQALLKVTQDIEHQLGRTKTRHWGSRVIDIDLLWYDELRLDSPELTLPHPHITDRKFVLVPLLEIAPDLVDPLSGEPYSAILKGLEGGVVRL